MGVGVEGDDSCLDCCFPIVFLSNHITGFAVLSLQTINYLPHINSINAFVSLSAFFSFDLWSPSAMDLSVMKSENVHSSKS